MLDFVQQLVSGIALGCVYGLIALGFVLVYKATEVVNFAQGDLMMLGGFFVFTFIGLMGLDYWLGFLFAVSFVRFRAAWVLGNFFEYPVWLICGFLVPLSLLPGWVHPIAWVLAPTWGMNAIRESALGGTPLPDLLLCLGLGAAYVAFGVLVTDRVLRAARERGSLSLT